jgi:hypothetical protein
MGGLRLLLSLALQVQATAAIDVAVTSEAGPVPRAQIVVAGLNGGSDGSACSSTPRIWAAFDRRDGIRSCGPFRLPMVDGRWTRGRRSMAAW